MASRRSLHGGKFGRVQAVITIALDHYAAFDAWCLVRGFNPLELPGYRFYHAVIAWLKDDRLEEDLIKIEQTLVQADLVPHPFHVKFADKDDPKSRTSRRPVKDSDNVPEEILKQIEAEKEGKPFLIPDWWRGEEANAKIAKHAMVTVPKSLGNFS